MKKNKPLIPGSLLITQGENMFVQPVANTNGINGLVSMHNYPERPVAEGIVNGFFTVDRKWTVKYWNKGAEDLLGVKAKDIIGKNLWEEFAESLPLNFYAVYHKAFLQNFPVYFKEYWGEMGAWFDVVTYYCDDILSISFKSSNQSTKLSLPTKLTQQLKMLNQLYRFVTEVTNDCLWEWDLQAGEIFWIDGGHKRIFGYPIENTLIPQSFWESRLHPDDKVRVLEKLDKIIADGHDSVWEDEYRFQRFNGNYAYVHDRGHIIYDENKKASRMIGATQDITQRVLLENKLTGERLTRQKEITNAVLTAQENERAEIGGELHDNLNQVLVVAKLYAQMAKKIDKDKEFYLDKCVDLIGDVVQEIRKISKKLVVPGIHIIGLFDNVKNLIYDLSKIQPVNIKFHTVDIIEKDLDEKLQLTIFRIVQEQINNILKHAGASRALINLSKQENQVVLLISDNGKGCDISKEKKGVGTINIRSRAELYGGKVEIVSKPGEGYELKVVLPFNEHS